jgi:hypothetical protein
LVFAEAGGSFRLSDDIHHASELTHDLRPKVAKAAVNQRLFAAWDAWLEAQL